MREVRFGSYSIVATRDVELVALEIHHPEAPLVAAALVARRDAPLVVAAAAARQRLQQRALRLGRGQLLERGDAHAAPRGRGWPEFPNAHDCSLPGGRRYAPSKYSILSPAFSVTMAFFQSGRLPT